MNATRQAGGRVVAVGTTVVRALESGADREAQAVRTPDGTNLAITPDGPVRTVDGIISGWHEHNATHLQQIEAMPTTQPRRQATRHEFGDSSLLLTR